MNPKTPLKYIILCLSLLTYSSICSSHSSVLKKGPEIKGLFVFGSSLVDNGNNNFLQNSTAKADYLPYGIDFPLGPSGRFTNGRNVIDLLGGHLKLPSLIPAFSDPNTKGSKIVHGVNYASGASGILDDTGLLAVRLFSSFLLLLAYVHVELVWYVILAAISYFRVDITQESKTFHL